MSTDSADATVPTLLLTLALNPPAGVPHLKMQDVSLRAAASKASLFFWASIGGIKKIVLADATGSSLLGRDDIQLLSNLGIEVEQICFEQDAASVQQRGKGFAEGALLDFAVSSSKILQEEGIFWKCTGKVFVRNFHQISHIAAKNRLEVMFWKQVWGGLDNIRVADTRFWLATTDFYAEHLSKAYQSADDGCGRIAEVVCGDTLNKNCRPGRLLRPAVTGMSGGFSVLYPEHNFGEFEHKFPCWVMQRPN